MEKFVLQFMWFEKYLGICLVKRIGSKTVPLTEYFFWPRTDAWEQLRVFLSDKNWITKKDSVLLLNLLTDVINYWQDDVNNRNDLLGVRARFPFCYFIFHE